MADVNVNVTETRRMAAVELTVGDYRRLFRELPDDVKVHTTVSQGDRPWESGSTTVSVNVPHALPTDAEPGVTEWRNR